jgi:hypothetical protein
LVIAKVGDGGKVSLFNFAGSTDLIADVVGWFPSTSVSITPAIGDYSALYGTAGEVTVHVSGTGYTVSVKTPFKIEGATCTLPAASVLATFFGAGPHFLGSHFAFSSTTCLATGGAGGISVYVNTDRTITLGTFAGPHLLTPL